MEEGEEQLKPVLWIHKASGRIRFDGTGLPESWIPLYAKEELELDIEVKKLELPEKAERVWNQIKGRKAPFNVDVVAKHFGITPGSASRHLMLLHSKHLLTRTRKGNAVFWTVKHEQPEKIEVKPEPPPVPVAVSQPPAKPQPSRPAPVVWPTSSYSKPQTSYPNIRGYDD